MVREIIVLDNATHESEWFNLIGGSSLAIIDNTSILSVGAKIKIKLKLIDKNGDFVESFYQSQPNVDLEFTKQQVIPFSLVNDGVQIKFILSGENIGDFAKIGIEHK